MDIFLLLLWIALLTEYGNFSSIEQKQDVSSKIISKIREKIFQIKI